MSCLLIGIEVPMWLLVQHPLSLRHENPTMGNPRVAFYMGPNIWIPPSCPSTSTHPCKFVQLVPPSPWKVMFMSCLSVQRKNRFMSIESCLSQGLIPPDSYRPAGGWSPTEILSFQSDVFYFDKTSRHFVSYLSLTHHPRCTHITNLEMRIQIMKINEGVF